MTAPHFATVPDVEPVVELGIGQTYGDGTVDGRWDIAHWDDDTDAHWSGVEPSWVDVTCDVRAVDSTVGHDRTLDTWDVGTCTVTVDNSSGWADLTLDPLNPAALDLRPGRAVRWGIRHAVAEIPGVPQVDGYLNPAVGTVSTPDTIDMAVAGDIRVTAKLRVGENWTSGGVYAVTGQFGGGGSYSWFFGRYTNRSLTQLSFDGSTTVNAFMASTAEAQAAFPPGRDLYMGTTTRMSGANQLLQSVDGIAWTPVGAVTTLARWSSLFNTTAPVRVGSYQNATNGRWDERIYWAQMEAINRARLVFPGVAGNFLSVPNISAVSTNAVEYVLRVSGQWRTAPGGSNTPIIVLNTVAGVYVRRVADGRVQVVGPTVNVAVAAPAAWNNGDLVWLRARVRGNNGTNATATLEWAPDAPTEPTSWTQIGSNTTGAITTLPTGPATIRIAGDTTAVNAWNGRIARVIVRNGIDGATVLDVSENNAGTIPIGTTFVATTGQTVTVTQTAGNTIVQAQPDAVIWRFDANDYPGTGTSYVDPRGRMWTLSTAGAITAKVPGVPPVPAHIATTWRFRGYIDAMRATYEGPHAETDSATLECIDALGEVARVNLAKLTTPVGDGETVNARLHRILDAVGWRTEWRDIAASNIPVFATDYGAQAADLLGATADTAAGALFGDYDGRVAFRNRDWQTWVPDAPPDLVLGNTSEATVCPSSIEVAFPRAGTTTRSLVNWDGADVPPVQRDDVEAQTLYGVETAPERLDLQTDDPTQLDILADRLLATRGAATMPRVNALTLDAGRDTATMLACLDADPQRPSRWRLVVERAGRPLLDRMLIVTAVSHSWDAGGWHTQVRLDDAAPWAAAGGRWDGSYWDAATWASGSDLVARLEALLEALEAAT